MNPPKVMIAVVALGLMGAGAGALLHLRSIQRLGEPGLKVVSRTNDLRVDIPLPEQVLDYTSTPVEVSAVELAVLPKDTSFARRLYRAPDGFEVLLGVVLMGTDRTSIHKPEYCLTSQGWQIVGRETAAIAMERPEPYELPVRVFTTRRLAQVAGGRGLTLGGAYLFWFVAEGHLTASHWARAGWISWDLVRWGVLPRWAYVSVFVVCPPGGEAEAIRRAEHFIRAAVPEFQRTTGQADGGVRAGTAPR